MIGETDNKNKNESRKVAALLLVLILLLGAAVLLLLPMLSELITTQLSPGIDLKGAAVISFFVTTFIMVLFAVASGDGLLGEIQFILGSFFLFFVIIWLLVAWIF